MSFKHRSILDTIPGYKQGKPAPAKPGQRTFKLSSNENAFEPLPSVVEAITSQATGRMNRYPDMRGWAVVERLAERYGVEAENVMLGCGSTEVITMLVNLVAGPGDEIVYPWRSFEAYPLIVAGAGATSVQVPNLPDGSHDVDGLIAAVNDRTRLVIVNNPNNPTSTSISDADARRIMQAVPSDVLVLFDEAYIQFNTAAGTSVAMDLFREYPNVVVAHTFSKAYGLAGLRIGYAFGQPEMIEALNKVAIPFSVNSVAQAGALASLAAQDELKQRTDTAVAERQRVIEATGAYPSEANFVWLPGETPELAAALAEQGVLVRSFPEGIRITVTTPEETDQLLAAWKAVRG